MKKEWWHSKVAYQIYPKSFCDSNGDGIGDLEGIRSKLDVLKSLGVDIIWLSPMFKSPFADEGYDISDYYSVDPHFGTLEDMDALIADAKARGVEHITLEATDMGRPLYEKYGFVQMPSEMQLRNKR